MDPDTILSIVETPGKLIKAAIALKRLYDAFFDENKSAATEAREFAQLVTTFAINLVNQGRLIRRAGKTFPGEENFKRTIKQCVQYLRSYDSLLREEASPVKKAYEVTKWQSDLAGDRRALIEKLNIHINFMNSFSMNVLLEIALRDREAIQPFRSPAGDAAAAREDKTLERFQNLYNKLYDQIVLLQNRQKRDKRYDQEPKLVMADLKKIIDDWRAILIGSGMPGNSLPELPPLSEHDTVDSIIYRLRRDMAREQSLHSRSPSEGSRASPGTPRSRADDSGAATPISRRPSLDPNPHFPNPSPHPEEDSILHSPIDNLAPHQPSPNPPPSIASSHPPSVWSPAQTIASRTTTLTDISLHSRRESLISVADSLSRLSVSDSEPLAEIKWVSHHPHIVRLHDRTIDDVRRPRSIIWNKGRRDQIEHKLGRSIHPFTKHSSFGRPMEVTFLDPQEIKSQKTYKASPTYTFYDEFEYRSFQSLVYRRFLLDTFDVEKIMSGTAARRGEAADQHVKLWKSMESDRHYLTFYANALEPSKYRQMLVTWFERPNTNDNTNTKPVIRLNIRQRHRAPSGPPRRLSGLGLALSPGKRNSVSSQHTTANDQDHGRRTSVTTDADDAHACPEDIQRLGFLELQFATMKERTDFVTAFVNAIDGALGNTAAVSLPSGPLFATAATGMTAAIESVSPTLSQSPKIPEVQPEGDVSDTASISSFRTQRATPWQLLGMKPPM